MFTFSIPGEPRGKGRPRFTKNGHAYTDKKTRDYEMLVAQCYQAQGGKDYGVRPVGISIAAYYHVPTSISKKKQVELLSRHPAKKPDADNVLKIVMDGLNGIAFKDDCQVCKASVKKLWGMDGHVVVSIEELEEAER